MSTGQKTGRIGALLFLRKVWAGILNLFVVGYLARVLSKSDFGLISICVTFISFIEVLGASGIGEYLIYKNTDEEKRDKIINSAFWLNMLVTLIIITIIVFCAPYWADYYKNPKIVYIIYILMFGLVSQAISSIPMSMLRKGLNYKPIIRIQFINGTLSQLVMLTLAICGLGVYSLAIPSAIFPTLTGIYLMTQAKPKIRLRAGIEYWKEIFSYTRYVIGTRLLGRLSNDGDNLILGKTLGMASLGVYDLSYKLSNLINLQLLPILTDISMPLFAKYNTQKQIVRRHYLYMVRIISFFLIPLYFLLIAFAPLVIRILYSNKWSDAVIPLQLLCMFSLARSISSPTAGLYNALGKPKIPFYFNVIFTPIFLLFVFVFSKGGLLAVCAAVTFIRLAGSIYHIYKVGTIIDLSFGRFLSNIKHIFLPNILLTVTCIISLHFIKQGFLPYVLMGMYLPVIYLTAYIFYRRSIMKDYIIFCMLFPKFKSILNFRFALKTPR